METKSVVVVTATRRGRRWRARATLRYYPIHDHVRTFSTTGATKSLAVSDMRWMLGQFGCYEIKVE